MMGDIGKMDTAVLVDYLHDNRCTAQQVAELFENEKAGSCRPEIFEQLNRYLAEIGAGALALPAFRDTKPAKEKSALSKGRNLPKSGAQKSAPKSGQK